MTHRWGDGIFNGGFKKGFLQKDKQADFVLEIKNTEVKCFDFLIASDLESLTQVAKQQRKSARESMALCGFTLDMEEIADANQLADFLISVSNVSS